MRLRLIDVHDGVTINLRWGQLRPAYLSHDGVTITLRVGSIVVRPYLPYGQNDATACGGDDHIAFGDMML